MNAIFVTGTDTNIGKTFISATLVKGLQGAYWKPIQAGVRELHPETDTAWVKHYTQLSDEHFASERYLLQTPRSPHIAARMEDVRIELDKIIIPDWFDRPLVVEGAGGVLVPLNEDALMIDLIERLDLPVLIVASSRVGTINHTCLTIEALRRRGASIAGVVLNGPPNHENARAIERYGSVPVLASVPWIDKVTPEALDQIFNEHFNHPFWTRLFSGSTLLRPRLDSFFTEAAARSGSMNFEPERFRPGSKLLNSLLNIR